MIDLPLLPSPYFSDLTSLYSAHWPLNISHSDLLIVPWRPQACCHTMEFALALCSCLEVSSSTYVHGLLCHFNRSSLKFIARERPCLTTFIPSSTFCYSLAFHIAFVSLHSSWHCLTIKYTSLFISLVRMQAPLCGDFDSPFHRANRSV